jgi:tRNA(Ile2) C34 agmatinyltransferase TiaS
MKPSTLSDMATNSDANRLDEWTPVCPCCGSGLDPQGGALRCPSCQFAFCQGCGDDLPG